ncbi:hypothetical protein Y032_0014g2484 [Ancylostoma ceylanicum]|uniref:Uncharacterized protein n=1 Tax=Ancylostoma ceylanicum TaxID=53326 RepID=A0A016VAV0_9BILA|nr:hypothetical protein Y032_0014g2484 [Ancylostoma ceylanicum]
MLSPHPSFSSRRDSAAMKSVYLSDKDCTFSARQFAPNTTELRISVNPGVGGPTKLVSGAVIPFAACSVGGSLPFAN